MKKHRSRSFIVQRIFDFSKSLTNQSLRDTKVCWKIDYFQLRILHKSDLLISCAETKQEIVRIKQFKLKNKVMSL